MQVIILESGSPVVVPDRACPSTLVRIGKIGLVVRLRPRPADVRRGGRHERARPAALFVTQNDTQQHHQAICI
ncbi:MAG: hypothetical protein ACKVQQ_02230 [Burkholderiales bacterium]